MTAPILHYLEQVWTNYVSVETVVSFLLLILAYTYIIRSDALYDFIGKILVKLELKIKGHYDHVPVDGESIVSAHRTRASWEMKRDNVAVFAIQGRRPHMEDRFNVVAELEHTNTSIYGIFDGHGGEFAADYVEKTLFKIIMVRLLKSALSGEEPDHAALLTESILSVDEQLLAVERETGEISGTTLLVALVRDNKLYVANVGDSRAVMCGKDGNTLPLSFDHKPQQVRERRRIKQAGGFISFNGVWRVAGVLATSRALGDYPLKERNFVIAEPDVLTFDLDESCPRFMIIATDGLWDAFSNEEAVEYVKERLHEPHYGAKSIVLQAYYRGSLDNITVMVVDFTSRTVGRASTREVVGDSEASSLATSDDEARVTEEGERPEMRSASRGDTELSSVATSSGNLVLSGDRVNTSRGSVTRSGDSVARSSDSVAISACVEVETVTCEPEETAQSLASVSHVLVPSGAVVCSTTNEIQVLQGSQTGVDGETLSPSVSSGDRSMRRQEREESEEGREEDSEEERETVVSSESVDQSDSSSESHLYATGVESIEDQSQEVVMVVDVHAIPETNVISQSPICHSPIGQSPIGQSVIDQSPIGQSVIDQSPSGQSHIGQSPSGQFHIGQSPIGQSALNQFPIGQVIASEDAIDQASSGQAAPDLSTTGQSTSDHMTSDEQTTSIVTVRISTGSWPQGSQSSGQ